MATTKKIALITGASSGIGKEIAMGLAKLNYQLIIVCRDQNKGIETKLQIKKSYPNCSIDLLLADLSSQADIKKLAMVINKHYQRLDVLVNNAGVVLTDKKLSIDGIELTLATNYLAPLLLTTSLLNLLQNTPNARVVNVSSAIHKWARINIEDLQFEKRKYHFMKAYAQSKLLMNIGTFELAQQLKETGITVNCFHPGAVKTNLGSGSANNIFLKLLDKIIKSFFITPQKAAETGIYLSSSPNVAGVTGKYFINCKVAKSKLVSDEFSKHVWNKSLRLIGNNYSASVG